VIRVVFSIIHNELAQFGYSSDMKVKAFQKSCYILATAENFRNFRNSFLKILELSPQNNLLYVMYALSVQNN
jgi:hypothetical protein